MKIFTLVLTFLFVFVHLIAFGANPAPYTKEVYEQIERAAAEDKTRYDANLSKEENLRRYVESWRNIFVKVGYNYDDTIVKVVNDARKNPSVLPKEPESMFTMICLGLQVMLLECKHSKVDCLQFFRPDSAQSVKWLMDNTDWGIFGPKP